MKITNNQGIKPDPSVSHHKQGLTFDCKECGKEHKQFHPRHRYCCFVCMWKDKGQEIEKKTCGSCGCTDHDRKRKGTNYTCGICHKLKENPERTDVTRRDPADYIDQGLRTYV